MPHELPVQMAEIHGRELCMWLQEYLGTPDIVPGESRARAAKTAGAKRGVGGSSAAAAIGGPLMIGACGRSGFVETEADLKAFLQQLARILVYVADQIH
jgi:hypothetical protein